MGLFLEPNLGEAPHLVRSKGMCMGSEVGLEVLSSCSGVLVSSVSVPS
jgi:hypothetical protein